MPQGDIVRHDVSGGVMVRQDVRISFFDDILDAIERFLVQHEDEAALQGDLERALVISYLLAVMRRDLDALLASLVASGVFGANDPLAVFEESVPDSEECAEVLRREARRKLLEQGWVPGGEQGTRGGPE